MSAKNFKSRAKNFKNRAQANPGMNGWDGLHIGHIPCYRGKNEHEKYRFGAKKGLRRARRRLDKEAIEDAATEMQAP